jgi:hypothetical protein
VDTSLVEGAGQVHGVVLLQHRLANNQIASFYTGAMAHAAELSFRTSGPSSSRSSRRNDPRDDAVRRGMPDARRRATSSIRVSSARACPADELLHGLIARSSSSATTTSSSCYDRKTGLDEQASWRAPSTLV